MSHFIWRISFHNHPMKPRPKVKFLINLCLVEIVWLLNCFLQLGILQYFNKISHLIFKKLFPTQMTRSNNREVGKTKRTILYSKSLDVCSCRFDHLVFPSVLLLYCEEDQEMRMNARVRVLKVVPRSAWWFFLFYSCPTSHVSFLPFFLHIFLFAVRVKCTQEDERPGFYQTYTNKRWLLLSVNANIAENGVYEHIGKNHIDSVLLVTYSEKYKMLLIDS